MISIRCAKEKCKDDISLIENYYEAVNDQTQKWVCHHRRELNDDGSFAYSVKDLIAMGLYYKRSAEELIFLTWSEHSTLHNKNRTGERNPGYGKPAPNRGVPMSEETKKKISEANKGKPSPMKGKQSPFKGKKHSNEAKQKMSLARKGKPPHNKGKHLKIIDGKKNLLLREACD